MSRRLFIKRSGGATFAVAVAPLDSPGHLSEPGSREISYQYRLFVSESPDRDDFIVSWMTGPNDEDRVEWALTGDGPGAADSSFSELKPIVGIISSPFAKATARSTPQLRRGDKLYDDSWLSIEEDHDAPPMLHFHHESDEGLDPEDRISSLKVEKSVIEASLSKRIATGEVLSTRSSASVRQPVKWTTEDGQEFLSQAAAEAHVVAHGNANIPALKIVSVVIDKEDNNRGGRFEAGEEELHSYAKSTDENGRVRLEQLGDIERRAVGLVKIVWKIEVQSRTRIERKEIDGGEIFTEYTEWKVIQRSP